MRKLLISLLLLLWASCALAEEPLYPAVGENGLYGYINAGAEWVIAPQFDWAGDFRGDYAVFMEIPDGMAPSDARDADCEGIIDRTGRVVVEPEYSVDPGYDGYFYGGEDNGIWIVYQIDGEEIREGFFDIPTGCFSGLQWGYVGPWCTDSDLIPVEGGYASRATGEMVIEGDFEWVDPAYFHDGIASVTLVLDEESGEMTDFFLINEQGETIPLPEGVHSTWDSQYSCGRVLVQDENGLYGYTDGSGTLVIPVQFPDAATFTEGYAAVTFPEGDAGYIGVDGSVLVRGFERASSFECGLATITLPGERRFIRTDGEMLPLADSDSYYPISTDRLWLGTGFRMAGPYHLVDGQGNILTAEPVDLMDFEPRDFRGGLQPVENEAGLWGYIDLDGHVAIPFAYTAAWAFDGDLAFVRLPDREGYIDRSGSEVYMWPRPDVQAEAGCPECGEISDLCLTDELGAVYCSGTLVSYPAEQTATFYTVRDGTTIIGEWAFADNDCLTEVILPEGVTMIDTGAFEGCNALTHVALPDSLLVIGDMAFYYCTALTDVTLPPRLYAIGPSAFVDCGKMTAVDIPETVRYIGSEAFCGAGLMEVWLRTVDLETGYTLFTPNEQFREARPLTIHVSEELLYDEVGNLWHFIDAYSEGCNVTFVYDVPYFD